MNPETKLQSFGGEGHPDENELLLALEHELPSNAIVQIDTHLGGCWSCRARSEEMRRGILTFVEYRENVYLPSLEEPPTEFRNFPKQLKSAVAETQRPSGGARFGQAVLELLTMPRPIRWVSAVAIITIITLLWTQILYNPTEISAQELLTRAIAAQNPTPPKGGVLKRKRIHQKVQIRSGARTVVRDYEWTTQKPMPPVRWKTQEDIEEWSSPLSAEAFDEWRNSLATKKDTVKPSSGVLTLTTTSETGPVKEASIIVRAVDFHPLEQHILLADRSELDFLELGFEVSDEAPSSKVEVPEDQSQTATGSVSKVSPANLDEVELNVRYVLFTHKLDLGEDLLISQVANDVMVTGTASSQARADAIQTSLKGMENVRFRVASPRAANVSPSVPRRSTANETPASTPPLGEEFLTKAFPSVEDRTNFVDRCLTASDKVLSDAWALKRLADRYSEADERRLKLESAEKLREMLRTHLRQLSQANAEVDPLLKLLPGSEDKDVLPPADLRSGIVSLFHQAQEQDSLVTKLVVGTPPAGEDLPTVAEELRVSHRTIKSLTDSLRNFL